MKILSYFVTLLLVSSNILAASFDEADELFDRRGEGSEIIEKATRTYENLLKTNLPQEDVIYAVEQIGKLQSLRGQMIPEAQIRKRKPFFARCLEAAEKIAPSKLSGEETPEYYFWFGSCKAQLSEAAGVTESLARSKEVHKILLAGMEVDPTYHGGGFQRILGGMYSKLPPINPFGPNGNLKEAVKVLEASIKSPSYEAEIDPAYGTGNYYFETYFLLAEVYIKLGEKELARKTIDTAVKRIDKGDFSPYRKPETELARQRLMELRP